MPKLIHLRSLVFLMPLGLLGSCSLLFRVEEHPQDGPGDAAVSGDGALPSPCPAAAGDLLRDCFELGSLDLWDGTKAAKPGIDSCAIVGDEANPAGSTLSNSPVHALRCVTGENGKAVVVLDFQPSSSMHVGLDFRYDGPPEQFLAFLQVRRATGKLVSAYYTNDGVMNVFDDVANVDGQHQLGSVAPGTWTHFEFQVDLGSSATLTIDDDEMATVPLPGTEPATQLELGISAVGDTQTGTQTVYIDDIVVSAIP